MNNTVDYPGGQRIGFTYFTGVAIGLIIFMTVIAIASYLCSRAFIPPQQRFDEDEDLSVPDDLYITVEQGLDEATLLSYPKLLYSEVKLDNKSNTTTTTCCYICLADYKSTDVLRMLPDCGHLFHLKCVDPWLRLHPTCPVCRTTPISTPQSTPLTEVVPLTIHRA
ncbi:hypothetical protein GIB67_034389 [Kingdonia uniflora]|uniref:RING-type domain-containing protein n=1 Tax=Kingdonia uniflora TaxID=39325 RepID=A0A7J7NS12_9MAGN|nr:hypothetical protein GIB67_034389 [Kingdonia uniflora]